MFLADVAVRQQLPVLKKTGKERLLVVSGKDSRRDFLSGWGRVLNVASVTVGEGEGEGVEVMGGEKKVSSRFIGGKHAVSKTWITILSNGIERRFGEKGKKPTRSKRGGGRGFP